MPLAAFPPRLRQFVYPFICCSRRRLLCFPRRSYSAPSYDCVARILHPCGRDRETARSGNGPDSTLKKRAQENRDYAIQLARQIYQRDLAAIDAIDHALPPQSIPEPTATLAVTNTEALFPSLVPVDKPFMVSEMLGWLQAAQPGQEFHEATIRTYVSRLSGRGVLKRLYKNGRNYTQWVASESFKEFGPVEVKPLVELVADIISAAGHPMRS